MTENKAKVLLCQMYLPQFDEEEKQALTIAIQALEEIQQYRAIGTAEEIQSTKERLLLARDMCKDYYAIGTIEEFKALKENSEPKKPKYRYKTKNIWDAGDCPTCGCGITARWDYCQKCSQHIDWQ